jgi:polysaccharide export outer membrane protein
MRKILGIILMFLMAFYVNTALAEDSDYLLGSGDSLKISVFNNPDLALEARISETGTISYPLLGEITIGGMTFFIR